MKENTFFTIEQILKARAKKIEKEMSFHFQAELEKKVLKNLHALQNKSTPNNLSIWNILSNYLCSLNHTFMSKKSLLSATIMIGLILVIVAVFGLIKPYKANGPVVSELSVIDSTLDNVDKIDAEAQTALQNFDNINENEDDENNLTLLTNSTTPVPPEKLGDESEVKIDTSLLDNLLKEIDSADSSANKAVNDLNSIDENQDSTIQL